MPYIPEARRRPIDPHLKRAAAKITDVGELTYALQFLVLAFLGDSPRYERYSKALGALTATTHETYRVEVAVYEQVKRETHGPVDVGDTTRPAGRDSTW